MLVTEPERLRATYNRASFESGSEPLDNDLKQRASQDAKRGIAFTYVMADEAENVGAYYTLTASSIDIHDLSPSLATKLPQHGVLGTTLIGRLAVDRLFQRQRIGSRLVAHAIKLSLNGNPAATIAVMVDALNDDAVAFYRALDFVLLPEPGRRLFLPRESLRRHLK
jgi:ribosomal protein S18 acetylase RimI-like enzyme